MKNCRKLPKSTIITYHQIHILNVLLKDFDSFEEREVGGSKDGL